MYSAFATFADWLHGVYVAQFNFWVAFGFIGQALFMMRFVVQWIASERARKSIIPAAFWFFSIGGGIVLLIYAIYRRDPVFIAGQGLGLVIYSRNIYFILREKRETVEAK
jgi:lipid-A-disaccharide synthase-like uncharacterized protein